MSVSVSAPSGAVGTDLRLGTV